MKTLHDKLVKYGFVKLNYFWYFWRPFRIDDEEDTGIKRFRKYYAGSWRNSRQV